MYKSYYSKYIKYKEKYISLRKNHMNGGGVEDIYKQHIENDIEHFKDKNHIFDEIVAVLDNNNIKQIIIHKNYNNVIDFVFNCLNIEYYPISMILDDITDIYSHFETIKQNLFERDITFVHSKITLYTNNDHIMERYLYMVIYEFFSRYAEFRYIILTEYVVHIRDNVKNINEIFTNTINKCIPIFKLFSNDDTYNINKINDETTENEIINVLEKFSNDFNRYYLYVKSLIKYIKLNNILIENKNYIHNIYYIYNIEIIIDAMNEFITNRDIIQKIYINSYTDTKYLHICSSNAIHQMIQYDYSIIYMERKHKILLHISKNIFNTLGNISFEDQKPIVLNNLYKYFL